MKWWSRREGKAKVSPWELAPQITDLTGKGLDGTVTIETESGVRYQLPLVDGYIDYGMPGSPR